VKERRHYERTSTSFRVEISHPSFGTLVGFAKDVSDGGAQVQLESQVFPPVGTEVMVRFRKNAGAISVEPVNMKVMYQMRNTIGLMFIKR
jgi:tetrahydromethanopterin S-methyltransferase subunit E